MHEHEHEFDAREKKKQSTNIVNIAPNYKERKKRRKETIKAQFKMRVTLYVNQFCIWNVNICRTKFAWKWSRWIEWTWIKIEERDRTLLLFGAVPHVTHIGSMAHMRYVYVCRLCLCFGMNVVVKCWSVQLYTIYNWKYDDGDNDDNDEEKTTAKETYNIEYKAKQQHLDNATTNRAGLNEAKK